VVLASDPSTISEWLAFVAIMATLAGLVGFLIRQARRRQRDRRAKAAALTASLPVEYRFRPEPLRVRILLLVVVFGSLIAAPVLDSFIPYVVAGIAVTWATLGAERHRRQHRQEIIESVRVAAPHMTDEQVRVLIEALELHHGTVEMRPLRELLGARVRDRPT
jgi:preprotein translocase subunit YajC